MEDWVDGTEVVREFNLVGMSTRFACHLKRP